MFSVHLYLSLCRFIVLVSSCMSISILQDIILRTGVKLLVCVHTISHSDSCNSQVENST